MWRQRCQTDSRGIYVFTGIRPATYTIRIEEPNFKVQERKGLVLAVSQQATLNFTLVPSTAVERVTVTERRRCWTRATRPWQRRDE